MARTVITRLMIWNIHGQILAMQQKLNTFVKYHITHKIIFIVHPLCKESRRTTIASLPFALWKDQAALRLQMAWYQNKKILNCIKNMWRWKFAKYSSVCLTSEVRCLVRCAGAQLSWGQISPNGHQETTYHEAGLQHTTTHNQTATTHNTTTRVLLSTLDPHIFLWSQKPVRVL